MRFLKSRCSLGAVITAVLLLCVAGATPAQSPPPLGELTLYGVRLRGASTEVFIAAALKAGATPLAPRADGPPSFDTRAAGAPALQRLTVLSDAAGLVSAQFVIKPYGQENEALRELLVSKYGLPTTADGARRPFPAFAARFAPRGSFDWDFAGGMKLIYRQPALGDATLSYTDAERAQRLSAPVPKTGASGAGSLIDRF
ncbi:MAG: hypothetical protein WCJ87_04210 [Burkholderiales bacterium]